MAVSASLARISRLYAEDATPDTKPAASPSTQPADAAAWPATPAEPVAAPASRRRMPITWVSSNSGRAIGLTLAKIWKPLGMAAISRGFSKVRAHFEYLPGGSIKKRRIRTTRLAAPLPPPRRRPPRRPPRQRNLSRKHRPGRPRRPSPSRHRPPRNRPPRPCGRTRHTADGRGPATPAPPVPAEKAAAPTLTAHQYYLHTAMNSAKGTGSRPEKISKPARRRI